MRRKIEEIDNFEATDSIEKIKESISKKKRAERKRRNKRLRSRIYKIALLVLLLTGIYFLDKSEYSRVRQIKVEGNTILTDGEILEALKIEPGSRMITKLPFTLNGKAKSIPGVASLDTKIYYTQGIVTIHVVEETPVGYIKGETIQVLFANGERRNLNGASMDAITGLPVFVGFNDETLSDKLLMRFGELDSSVILAISEVHSQPDKYDPTAMKLTMNNNFFVYTGMETLPLMRSYATIIKQADPKNKCIYMNDYGPSEGTSAVNAKPCE
ncbi:FtsQ-type POTRA domain-containing protein [Erysipelothrix sp. HDW6C]|uniref:cell division protein FtsQ/DivIB n=1 Tax=Erysipelothrix sp. HDW6C TaxID=2714930 RepID=UPI00140E54F8|nr:FtsQ-type POTRA domain-containing protein [Erysipelothrix sp. HDW6C]QIK70090.1 FtsQ-type POTRA domain-containing protein [Erysipelothrix sp. HDW6C]